jgi:hypothetical protein
VTNHPTGWDEMEGKGQQGLKVAALLALPETEDAGQH